MSAPVISSTFDAATLNDDPTTGIFLQHDSIDDEWIGDDNEPLQVAGVFARPRRLLRRTVNYVGFVQGDPNEADQLASVRGYLHTFETTFIPSNSGDLVEQLEDGSTRTLTVRPTGVLTPGPVPEFWNAVVAFVSYEDPEWDIVPAGS